MNKEYTPEEIKNRLSNIGEAVGNIALGYITELEKENAELKSRLNAVNLLTPELEKCSRLKKQQLTKAKEIIKDYMIIVTGGNITVCSVPEENRCINVLELNERAAQFLKEQENG